MVKNRFKTLILRQKKLFPNITNEFTLLKTFVKPYESRNQEPEISEEEEEEIVEKDVEIKDEHQSVVPQLEKKEEEEAIDLNRFVRE